MIAWWLNIALALGADIRGMTVSTPTWGWEWGSDAMAQSLTELHRDGVNWVSIHPYARIHADGAVTFRPIDPADPPEWLVRPIREAHARGMKVMIKPHLAYWGSPFSWRGAIAFPDEVARKRFFATYRAWIAAMARVVGDADALCVGTELDRLVEYEADWRKVIADVRTAYAGPLTYASNWDAIDKVPFWDALDVIGVQAYFPILDRVSVDVPVTEQALRQGWDRVMARLHGLSERQGKHIVFTELGYDTTSAAPVEPWRGGRESNVGMQLLCTRVALEAIDREPAVIGAFLWKWFPGELQHGDFRMSSADMRQLIRAKWGGG